MSYVLQFFIAAIATVTFAILFASYPKISSTVVCGTEKGTGFLWRIRRACLAGLFYFVQAVGECGFGQSGGNLCFDNFKSYSGSSKMQSCHDLSGIRDFSTGSGSRYLLYGILSDIRNAGKMLGKRAGNF